MNRVKRIFDNILVMNVVIFLLLFTIFTPRAILFVLPQGFKLLIRVSLMMLIFLIYFIKILKYKKIDTMIVMCVLFSIYQITITYISHGDYISCIYSNLIIAISSLLVSEICYGYNKKQYLDVALSYFVIINVINLVSGFLPKEDVSTGWFFYNRNHIIWFATPLIILIYNKYQDNKKVFIPIIFIQLAIYIYCGSLTSLLSFTIFIIYYLLFINKNIKLLNLYVYILVVLMIFCFFVLPGTKSIITQTISEFLGKGDNASGRFEIYDNAIEYIKKGNIVFGNGMPTGEIAITITGSYTTSHSTYLNIMQYFGIIGYIFCLIIIKLYVGISDKASDIKQKNFMHIFMGSLLFWSITENFHYYLFTFYLGLLIYNVGKYEFNFITKKIEFTRTN